MTGSIEKLAAQVNEAVRNIQYNNKVVNLYDPIRYTLDAGGKRVRPLLMLMAYRIFRADHERILPNAIAMEVYHNFTLLHDDVMDRAEMRRGRACVHVRWNDNTAILSGDTMLALSYKLMTENPAFTDPLHAELTDMQAFNRAMRTFNEATVGVCEGQQFDMDFENTDRVSEDDYMEMIRLKTSLLLSCSLKIGAQLAGADEKAANLLYDFGEKIGLAFQLQDDLLDVYADEKVFGKHTGGDIVENKKTFMLIKTFELADDDQRKTLKEWIGMKDFNRAEKISAVTAIYDAIGIRHVCERKIEELFSQALAALAALHVDEDKTLPLKELALQLMHRQS